MVTAFVEAAIIAGSLASPRYRSEPVMMTHEAFDAARLPRPASGPLSHRAGS